MVDNRLSFQEISQLIEDQFPAIYREEGPILVAFLKAYYEWLETTEKSSYNEGRKLLQISDVDTTLEAFLDHFKYTYLDGFPYSSHVDVRFMIKHIMDFYRTKGTTQSTALLMKLLFGEEVEIYLPGGDVLKPSDSVWKKPQYIEVSTSPRTSGYIDKKIFGSISGASAFVDSVVRKRIAGKLIDIIYISSVQGTFVTGDAISDDGDVLNAPISVGSLSYFNVESGGRNNKVGDVFDVVADGALHGKVRVTGTEDATGRVDFGIIDGGHGYTQDENTKVYVSNTVITVDNSNLAFIDLEKVYQKLEKINILSATTLNATAVPGDIINGYDALATKIAEGTLVSIAATGANSTLTVDTTFGTFLDQLKLTVNTSPVGVQIGEHIDEEGKAEIVVTSSGGTITVGQLVEQFVYHPDDATLVTKYSSAIVESIDGSEITVNSYFGEIKTGSIVVANTFTATVGAVSPITTPAFATVVDVTGLEISVTDVNGVFNSGNKISSRRTRKIRSLTAVGSQGASDVELDKNSATGVVDTTENVNVEGIVVGQSLVDVGVYGNNNFAVSNTYPLYLRTDRATMISPPRDANGDIIDLAVAMTAKSAGTAATFAIGNLVNEQTVTVNTDFLRGYNATNVAYLDIRLDGTNSGVNKVGSFFVNTPGTGYTNGSVVTLSGGGYGGSEPYLSGNGLITTDGAGAITSVAVDETGSGYYEIPTVVLPATGGTTANVSVVLDLAYGFPKSIAGNLDSVLEDLFEFDTMTIGTIASLKSVNPGVNYNKSPYVRVYNGSIAAFRRGNFNVYLDNVIGAFQPGEEIYQQVGPEIFEKGTVIGYDSVGKVLHIERDLFETDFNDGIPLVGSITGSSGDIVSVSPIDEYIFGDNAEIDGTVIAANGVITSVEVIDSGYGYEEGEASLESNTNLFVVSGTALLGKHGIGEGFWTTTTSHLNSEKKIHDNDYYQEFSYDIVSSISLSRYADILKTVTHVAGTKMFGSIVNASRATISGTANSEITIYSI